MATEFPLETVQNPLIKELYFRNKSRKSTAKAEITVYELNTLLIRLATLESASLPRTEVPATNSEYPTRTIGE